MKLTVSERAAIVQVKMQKARQTLVEAKDIAALQHWHAAVNRLYYACYYAASALLIKSGFSVQTHSGVIGQIGKHFIHKGLIGQEWGKFYRKLFELRQAGDYNDWIAIKGEDVIPLLPIAEEFIALMEKACAEET
jgi:uncharacterized protein (UPF0332 family)